ncbi:MAG: hypothetical protein H7259_07210 [Cytophagales bacterium]|nr:hypothetical protein [Cytophaga sp.]
MKYTLLTILFVARTVCFAVDAKSFGAKGDGIQDDTPYLNNAIAGALAAGEDLFIPSGTYMCNIFTSESNILMMDQIGVKKIRIYGEDGTKITTSKPIGSIFYVYYAALDVVIENIFFENTHGITMTQTNAIVLAGTNDNAIKNFTIKNCRFEGFSTAISPQGVKGLTISNNIFESPKGHDNAQDNSQPAVYVWLADNQNGQCYDVQILNNLVNGYTGSNIATTTKTMRPMDGFVFGTGYNVRVEGNITRNLSEEHIAFQPSVSYPALNYPVVITGNKFYQSLPAGCMKDGAPLVSNYGVRTDCNNVTISNNDFYDYTVGVLIWPFQYPLLKQHGYVVSGNRFYSPNSKIYYFSEAVKVQATQANPASDIRITDNIITIDGIQLKSNKSVIALYDCAKITIQNNNIKSKNVDLNKYILSGILVQRCTEVANTGNVVDIK